MGSFSQQLLPTSFADTIPDLPTDVLKNPGVMFKKKQLMAPVTSRYGDEGLIKSKMQGD